VTGDYDYNATDCYNEIEISSWRNDLPIVAFTAAPQSPRLVHCGFVARLESRIRQISRGPLDGSWGLRGVGGRSWRSYSKATRCIRSAHCCLNRTAGKEEKRTGGMEEGKVGVDGGKGMALFLITTSRITFFWRKLHRHNHHRHRHLRAVQKLEGRSLPVPAGSPLLSCL